MCQAVYERYDCQHEGSDFLDVWACEEYHKNPTFHCNMERGTYLIDGKCPGCRDKEKTGELQKRTPPSRAKTTDDKKWLVQTVIFRPSLGTGFTKREMGDLKGETKQT